MEKDVFFCLDACNNQDAITIEACHQVMANASPVFRVMLDRNKFKEGGELRNSGRCEIPLGETHAGAFQVLCQIFHLQSHLVTDKMDITLLYEIASLVDRYDCLTSIQPWPKIWRQENKELFDWYSTTISSADLASVLRMVHISSIFKFDDVFTNSTKYFLSNIRAQNFAEAPIEQLYNDLMPDVQDFIFKRLDTCRQGMRALAVDTITSLEAGISCKDPRTLDPTNRFNCASMLLGNALLGMVEVFGPDWRSGDQWEAMPVELYEPMLRFAKTLGGPRWVRTKEPLLRGHTECSLDKTLTGQIEILYDAVRRAPSLAELKGATTANGDESDWQTVLYQLLHTGCHVSEETS